MFCKLYQYPSYHPDDEEEFESCVKKAGGKQLPKINAEKYQLKFMGLINCTTIEEAFCYLDTARHPLNFGHTLLGSEVLVTPDGAFAYIDSGIIPVCFDEAKAIEKPDLARAVMILPGLPAFETRIDANDEELNSFFGGKSDYIYLDNDLVMRFNHGLNAAFYNNTYTNDYDYHVINGPCIITKAWYKKNISLTDEDVEYCIKRFSVPVFNKGLIFGIQDSGYCSYDAMDTSPPESFQFLELGEPHPKFPINSSTGYQVPDLCKGCLYAGPGCNACLHD